MYYSDRSCIGFSGSSTYFFGYRFVLWQLLGLSAHIAVAQLLLGFLRRTVIGGTVLPLLLALLFGVSYLPAELVLRNHLTTYTVFALLALCTTMGMSELLATDRDRTFCAVLSSSAIAAFTYELGVVMSGCLQPCVFCTPAAHDNRAHRSSQTDGYVESMALSSVAVGYIIVSWAMFPSTLDSPHFDFTRDVSVIRQGFTLGLV